MPTGIEVQVTAHEDPSQPRSRSLEHILGQRVQCVMGIETLNNAARAAGYAMAASDDLLNSSTAEVRSESEAWRPGEAIMPSQAAPQSVGTLQVVTEWVKSRVFGVFSRGAPA